MPSGNAGRDGLPRHRPEAFGGLVALGRLVMGSLNLNVRNMERAGAGKDVEFACRSGFFGSVGLCWRRLFLNFAP